MQETIRAGERGGSVGGGQGRAGPSLSRSACYEEIGVDPHSSRDLMFCPVGLLAELDLASPYGQTLEPEQDLLSLSGHG